MQRAKRFLNIAVSVTVGVYLGKWLFLWWDHRTHPDLYALTSAPWYTQMLPATVIAAGLIAVELAVFFLVRRAIRRKEEQ